MLKPSELDERRIGKALEALEDAERLVINAGPDNHERFAAAQAFDRASKGLAQAVRIAAENAQLLASLQHETARKHG